MATIINTYLRDLILICLVPFCNFNSEKNVCDIVDKYKIKKVTFYYGTNEIIIYYTWFQHKIPDSVSFYYNSSKLPKNEIVNNTLIDNYKAIYKIDWKINNNIYKLKESEFNTFQQRKEYRYDINICKGISINKNLFTIHNIT
jgi:hypothetical protein